MNQQQKQISWHQTKLRWIFLLMTCIFQVGCCLCSDFPSVLATQIQKQFRIQQSDVNYLFTLYSLPNIIFPFFGGIIIDKIGVRTSLVVFAAFLVIGQGMCYYGSLIYNYDYLKGGMMLMGLGGEICMSVAQSSIVSKWFIGQEMALAFGLKLTFTRLGSVLGVNLLRYTYIQFNESFTMCMLVCFLIISVIWGLSFIQISIDKKSDQRDGLLIKDEESNVSLTDIKQFKLDFYLVSLSCVLTYSAFIALQQNCLQMFKIRYNLIDKQATFYYSLPYYISAVITPIFGGFVDKIGRRPLIIIISGILLLLSTSLYSIDIQCQGGQCFNISLLAQILSGFSFAIFAPVIWPCVPLCINQKAQGTGFGVVTSIQNIGLTLLPLIIGNIVTEESEIAYYQMSHFIRFVTIIATISNITLFLYDKRNGGKLSQSTIKAKNEKQQ